MRVVNTQLARADLRRRAPVAIAWAEYTGLTGAALDPGDPTLALELATQARPPWYAGELAWWLRRTGTDLPVRGWYAEPYRLVITGDWRGAAEAWEQLGCVYEQADALARGLEPDACLRALELLEALGAHAAARALRRLMRGLGGFRIPRGPRPTTAVLAKLSVGSRRAAAAAARRLGLLAVEVGRGGQPI
ncbi:hypothetical protein [Rugosimonospora africana]|uniref:Uncharacterized protein n=1 Tax=Rugosimonospora africana TaxID=556532 RepID=A0A8J3R204_9ACTN|nr:hypothetical protein [Rugosimonospora africana]GIH21018.1 hypothetical protein Raf01_91900 [Rugosimonospora africana]